MQLSEGNGHTLLNIARASIIAAFRGNSPSIETSDAELVQPAGCFVSLHSLHNHALRGGLGRMDAVEPLIRCVRDTAQSVLCDPRFLDRPILFEELGALAIDISILSPLRPAAHALDFDLLNDGIYLTCGARTGVFLPQVARETGWNREQLLDRLCSEKLGMPPRSWQSGEAQLQVFSTMILGPEPFLNARPSVHTLGDAR